MGSLPAAGIAILLAATTAAAQTGVRHERVAGNVWRIDGAVDVLLVQTGPDGTLLVDTGYPFAEAGVRQALREIAGGDEVTRLINTHSHHAFANHLYAGNAEIVAHERAARRIAGGFLMAGQAVPAALPEARPSRTFADSLRLHMNGEDITLLHLPGAHTDGDVAVIFHGSNVVAAGDVLVPHMSWVNLDEGGSLEGLLEALDVLLRVVPEGARIVPGHDPVTLDRDDLRTFRAMIVSAADTVRARMAAGLSLRRIQALGLPGLESWRGAVPEALFIESLYRSMVTARAAASAGTLEVVNGLWWDGSGFVARTMYAVDGVFVPAAPGRVDRRLDLEGGWVVPPYGEAHTHRFGDPAGLEETSAEFLEAGVFYAMVQDPLHALGPAHRELGRSPASPDVAFTQGVVSPSWGVVTQMYGMLAERGLFGEGVGVADLDGDVLFTLDTVEEVKEAWPALAARNDRFLKVIVAFADETEERRADPERFPADLPNGSARPGVTPEVLRALVGRAHEAGLRVSAHVETAADFRLAVAAGADWIAHMPAAWQIGESAGYGADDPEPWLLTPEDARAARMAGTIVSTTLSGRATDGRAELFRTVHTRNLRALADAGVTLAIGSDRFDGSSVDEAIWLGELGVLDAPQLLMLLSQQTPRLIFPELRIGHLRPGYEASFLVLRGDPREDLERLRDITLAVKRGVVVGPE